MAQNQKSYDNEFKAQAVKLAQEIGGHKAAQELGIPKGTMYTWIKAFKEGRLSANEAVHTPKNALSLNDELIELRKRVKEQDKEIRRLKEENEFLEEASAFFAASRQKVSKKQRLMFIAIKTDDGRIKGKISFYCKVLHVSRQAFNKFLKQKIPLGNIRHWQMQCLIFAAKMNAMTLTGRIRMYQALQLKQPEGVHIPGERTVYRVMAEIGLNHKPKRKPNAITKADREASKSDDLIKRDFAAEKPLEKCMTDMTEIKASDGKLYVSAIFDCYDLAEYWDLLWIQI